MMIDFVVKILSASVILIPIAILLLLYYISLWFSPQANNAHHRLATVLQVWHLLFGRAKSRDLYLLTDGKIFPTFKSDFMNLGIWNTTGDNARICSYFNNNPEICEYGRASSRMAFLLADAVGLNANDTVLDVGFGNGNQDFLWMDNYSPRKIVGINFSEHQVAVAQQKLVNRCHGFSDSQRIELKYGNAVEIQEHNKYDVVFALESAFHFNTREEFLKRSYAALKPNGRIALADIVPNFDPHTLSPLKRFFDRIRRKLWVYEQDNYYSAEVYEAKMEEIGFKNVEISVITEEVFNGLRGYAELQLKEQRYMVHWSHRWAPSRYLSLSLLTHTGLFPKMDYLIVTGTK